MKLLFSGIVFALSIVFSISTPLYAQKAVLDIYDQMIDLPSKSGKWVIVSYWAEWCGPCKREIPVLNDFYKKHQDKILLVGVHSEVGTKQSLQTLTKSLNIQFPILQEDPMKVVDSLVGMPSTYFISPAGKVFGPVLGTQTEASLLNAIKKYS